MQIRSRAFVLLLIILPTTVLAQNPQDQTITAQVDKLFAQWDKPDSPGCAVGIIKNSKLVYARGYGRANLEYDVPIGPRSVFLIASISKQFTAMSVLMLAEQKKLSLDDDIRKYVPEVPDFGKPLTIRQLLHHTSGIRDQEAMFPLADFREHDVMTEGDALKLITQQKGLNYEPGEDFIYSNTGYTLLSLVVKRVSGQSLREFAAANIFKPLGMNDTQFVDNHTTVIKNWAQGYENANAHWRISSPLFDFVGPTGVYTTVGDLARWDQNFYDHRVGSAWLFSELQRPGKLNDGHEIDYAAGLFVGHWNGLPIVEHDGGDPGYRADFLRFPEQQFSIAALCNVTNIDPTEVTRNVAAIYLADEFKKHKAESPFPNDKPVTVPPSELASVAALYFNPVTEAVRRIVLKDGKLLYVRGPNNESALIPFGNNRFGMADVASIRVNFTPAQSGWPSKMSVVEIPDPNQTGSHGLSNIGTPAVFEVVREVNYSAKDLAEFAGDYYSAELDVTYTFKVAGSQLVLKRKKSDVDEPLTPKFIDMFNAAVANQFASIRFKRDARHKVNGFTLTVRAARKIAFEKL
ncbi:MAG TPA: serine hydrolase domain-containing protein [Pyrinomonadaceae bacterium]|nr:serine hydrolase domain-containing protein [Pyrinomonadaceae bacterium]